MWWDREKDRKENLAVWTTEVDKGRTKKLPLPVLPYFSVKLCIALESLDHSWWPKEAA